jgi:predicted anti-sigma-YlaC factor YlaD
MNTNHLSAWEQEEYLLDQRTPQMLRHLSQCEECRAAVEQLQQGVSIYRRAAVQWSAESLAAQPQRMPLVPARPQPMLALRWAVAAIVPIVLLLLALFPLHVSHSHPVQPAAQISDDALLDEVDEQLSVTVPSSMESLTHLVSTDSRAAGKESKHLVQNN